MKPVTGLSTFANQAPPWSLTQLDADIAALQAAINDFNSYSNPMSDTSGVANAITVTTPANITASYTAGLTIWVKVANTTTATAVTVNLNALGLKNVVIPGFSALIIGQLLAGGVYELFYDGTNFQVIGAIQAINSTGGVFTANLLVGANVSTSFNIDGAGLTPQIQLNLAGSASEAIARYTNEFSPPRVVFGKSRAATPGTQTIVQSGDQMGAVYFTGSDGAAFQTGAAIVGIVDAAPAAGSMPGALHFRVTPSGSVSSVDAMIIGNGNNVNILTPVSGTSLTVNGSELVTVSSAAPLTPATTAVSFGGLPGWGPGVAISGGSGTGANNALWALGAANGSGEFQLFAISDAGVRGAAIIDIARSGIATTSIKFGDATNNPTIATVGTGATTLGGNLSTTGGIQVSGPTGGVLGNGTVNVSSGFFINGVNVAASGSFTGTLTGFTTTVTGTINYRITNGVVTLWPAGTLQGTSNAASMTLTGAPAAIQPSVLRQVPCAGLQDNSSAAFTLFAYASVATNGVISFTYPGGTPIGSTLTNPTNVNLKGISTSTVIVYPL